MKIYIAFWAVDLVDGVFSTREAAVEFIKNRDDNEFCEIREYELDNPDYYEETA